QFPEVCLMALHTFVERFYRTFHAFSRQESIIHNVRHFHLISSLPCQNQDFSHHISTSQIQSRIRLSIALGLGLSYHLRKRTTTVIMIEYVIESSAQYCFYFMYFIAAMYQII